MIALFLLACDPSTGSPDPADSAVLDSADPVEAAVTMGTCLAEGGALVERAASAPWAAGLNDLELSPDGAIYALTDDGHLLLADPADPSAWADLGTRGEHAYAGSMLDVTGASVLMSFEDISVGSREEALSDWRAVGGAHGDVAISPDGETAAWVWSACGLSWGVVDAASGREIELDEALYDTSPMAFEYLDDGRLVATTWGSAGSLLVLDDLSLAASYPFSGGAEWFAPLETLGEVALTATLGEGSSGTLERVDLGSGLHTSVALPFATTAEVALSGALSWALGTGGELVATDGETLFELGTPDGVTDLVADPDEDWLATAGEDGVLRVYGCE